MEDMQGAWWGHLEKTVGKSDRRGPTSFPSRKTVDKHRYKAIAEMRWEAAESAGHSLALAPWGSQRVRRRSPVFFGDQEDTPTIVGWTSRMAGVQLAHG